MSIVVAIKVPEGLVFAADSTSTLHVIQNDGQAGVGMIYNNANKLMRLKDYPIGIATWGAGSMGARTVISFVEEFENGLEPYSKVEDKLQVEEVAEQLKEFLMKKHAEAAGVVGPPQGPQPSFGILIGGYSSGKFFSDHFVFNIPQGDFKPGRKDLDSGLPDFGANWYGANDAIGRLHFGFDERIFRIMERLGIPKELVENTEKAARAELQYPIPFPAMPIRDALDFAEYVVSVVVGRFRFVIGPPICGGPIDVAQINRKEGFRWYKKKGILVEGGRYGF